MHRFPVTDNTFPEKHTKTGQFPARCNRSIRPAQRAANGWPVRLFIFRMNRYGLLHGNGHVLHRKPRW